MGVGCGGLKRECFINAFSICKYCSHICQREWGRGAFVVRGEINQNHIQKAFNAPFQSSLFCEYFANKLIFNSLGQIQIFQFSHLLSLMLHYCSWTGFFYYWYILHGTVASKNVLVASLHLRIQQWPKYSIEGK